MRDSVAIRPSEVKNRVNVKNARYLLVFVCFHPGCGKNVDHSGAELAPRSGSRELEAAQQSTDVLPHATTSEQSVSPAGAGDVADPQESIQRQPQLDFSRVRQLVKAKEFEDAEETVRAHLIANPNDPAANFQWAQILAARGNYEEAIAALDQPVIQNSEAALPALGQSAAWCLEQGRPYDAESRYRKVLAAAPDAVIANRSLCELLLRMGRGHVAAEPLRQLCRSGNIKQSELAALVALSDATFVPGIGPAYEARLEASQNRFSEAIDAIEPVIDHTEVKPDMEAFYLRLLAEAQRHARLRERLSICSTPAKQAVLLHSDYWAALGALALHDRDAESASGALLKALSIDPTDGKSLQRLRQSLVLAGDDSWDQTLGQRYRQHHNSILASNRVAQLTADHADPSEIADSMDKLAGHLEPMGRRIEAVLWRSIAARQRGAGQEIVSRLRADFEQLADSADAFPTAAEKRFGIPDELFPVPAPRKHSATAGSQHTERELNAQRWPPPPTTASWINVAAEYELNHQFQVAAKPQRDGFAIYQQFGGGVAAADFDRDGRCDLFFAQGAADPPDFESETHTRLFRNVGGRVVDVSVISATAENDYVIGVTAGDWNHDGLDDLAMNAFGSVIVLTNNGDGTFRRDVVWRTAKTWMPASIAMADVHGDGWIDLVVLGYAAGEMIWMNPPRDQQGRPTQSMGPSNFAGAENQLIRGSSTGWGSATPIRSNEPALDRSLGLIVGPLAATEQDHPLLSNQIFVGNDQQNNRLWTMSSAGSNWTEAAMVYGCAFGNFGNATAAMGIASADLNQDGFLDLHITNYQNEPVSLYQGGPTGFVDQTVRLGLHLDSIGVLGFGCLAIDFDLNGLPDLMVTNGHIDDATETDEPFEQPMQLFALRDGRYEQVAVDDASAYWQRHHVGRAMAKLDLNNDGREDVAITNLNEPCALLVNQTQTDHHWLRLELVGVKSPRYPVGAGVEIETQRVLHHTIVAGDGYLCRNEPAVHVGLGAHRGPVNVVVTWPDGTQQEYSELGVDKAWQLTQGDATAFSLSP